MKNYIKTRTVQSLIRDMKKEKIILDTSIQRKSDQWDRKKKSLLILSAIQGVIIPGIFAKEIINSSNEFVWEVLDGKQRLTTLASFLNDEFKLDRTYSEEYANKLYSQLGEETQNTIKNTEIVVNVYQDLNEQETEDIFCRLNNGQKLSNDNIFRAHMGEKLRAFVDEAISKPFIKKTSLTKGQIRKSEDEGVILAALSLVSDYSVCDFSKKSLMVFIDEFKANYNEDDVQKVLDTLDWLDTVIEKKHKNLKKVSLPMIIAVAAHCPEDKKEQYAERLNEFLDDYENRADYLQYCSTSTASCANVSGRLQYFLKMRE